ncbi:MAG: hypothetical protein Q4D52_02095 [Eubacteriales bacterium]|nr:hypothetical protein [Eubacteriales bacterium]
MIGFDIINVMDRLEVVFLCALFFGLGIFCLYCGVSGRWLVSRKRSLIVCLLGVDFIVIGTGLLIDHMLLTGLALNVLVTGVLLVMFIAQIQLVVCYTKRVDGIFEGMALANGAVSKTGEALFHPVFQIFINAQLVSSVDDNVAMTAERLTQTYEKGMHCLLWVDPKEPQQCVRRRWSKLIGCVILFFILACSIFVPIRLFMAV